jgi:hypothetical protein
MFQATFSLAQSLLTVGLGPLNWLLPLNGMLSLSFIKCMISSYPSVISADVMWNWNLPKGCCCNFSTHDQCVWSVFLLEISDPRDESPHLPYPFTIIYQDLVRYLKFCWMSELISEWVNEWMNQSVFYYPAGAFNKNLLTPSFSLVHSPH